MTDQERQQKRQDDADELIRGFIFAGCIVALLCLNELTWEISRRGQEKQAKARREVRAQ